MGYSISDRMKARLAVNAPDNAVSRRRDAAGCIVHSDRGSQGGFNWSSQHLDRGGGQQWRRRTREELRIATITWIERTYHRRRRQARLGRLTPIEYETIMNPSVDLAA